MLLAEHVAGVLNRVLGLPDHDRSRLLGEEFSNRPLLQSTLVGLLDEGDGTDSFLQTGGAWDDLLSRRIAETLSKEPLAIGDRAGSIRILGTLGVGGMGTVYLGFDETLEREVAVKTVHLDPRTRAGSRERFELEARVLSRLNHPAICQIYQWIEAEAADGSPFQGLVLERVEGETLREAMAGLGLGERLRVMEQIAEALAVAHDAGIIHRDLKPDNVMLTPTGAVKILDFGISSFSRADAPSSLPGAEQALEAKIVGTPRYMSPEQALCEPLSFATDLYAFGLMLQEVVTGRAAHQGIESPVLLISRAAEARTEDLGAEVDPALASLVAELLRRDPKARPTAEEARERLRWILDRPVRRRRRRLTLALAALLTLAVGAALWGAISAWQSRRDSERQSLAARRLGEEVRSIDSLLRIAYLAPRHDVGIERRRVEERLRRIEADFASLGAWAGAPLAYARGRIALALDRPEEARTALEQSWEAGYRNTDVAEALGVALGQLYDAAVDQAQRQATLDLRRAAMERADETFRRPAVEWLHRSMELAREGSSVQLSSLSRARIALYEERFADSRSEAALAIEAEPWLYEALRLESRSWEREMRTSLDAGDSPQALLELRAAEEALDAALVIARSDPGLFLERCRVAEDAIYLLYVTGRDSLEAYQRSISSCWAARELLPGQAEPWLAEARVEYRRVWSLLENRKNPASALDRLRVAAEKATELSPTNADAHRLLGMEASERAQWAGLTGESEESQYERALVSLRRAVELAPGDSDVHYSLGSALFNAGFDELVVHGGDPRSYLTAAVASLAEAQRLAPTSYSPASMMGSCYGVMAMYALENGIDPLDFLENSIGAFERALQSRPGAPAPRGNLGLAYRDLATYYWLVGESAELVDDVLRRGRETTLSLIADKQDSAARVTLSELELLRARSLLDRGLDPEPALVEVDTQLASLRLDEIEGTDLIRIEVESLSLRARAAREQPDEVARLAHKADALTDNWLASGGSFRARLLRAEMALRRAEAGIRPQAEAKRGLVVVAQALEVRADNGEAWLLRARLLRLAGSEAAEIEEALRKAETTNPWLSRQANEMREDFMS